MRRRDGIGWRTAWLVLAAAGCAGPRPAPSSALGACTPLLAPEPADDARALSRALAQLDSPDLECRLTGQRTIERLGPAAVSAAPRFEETLRSGPWRDRPDAARLLARVAGARSVPALVQALSTRQVRLQQAAAVALGTLGPEAAPALPALAETAREHWAWEVRKPAADAIARVGGPDVRPRPAACRSQSRVARARLEVEVEGRPRLLSPVPWGPASPAASPSGTCFWLDRTRREFVLHEQGDTCIVGSVDEPGTAGHVVALQGRARSVLREGWDVIPRTGVRLGEALLVLEGGQDLHLSIGLLSRVAPDAAGTWRGEPVLELPGAPLGWGMDGSDLLVLAEDALASVEPPCASSADAPRRTAYLLRIRPDLSVTSLE